MALRRRLIELPLHTGVQAGVDAKVSQAPIKLENAVFPREGAIAKRTGLVRSAAANTSAKQINALRDHLVVTTDEESLPRWYRTDDDTFAGFVTYGHKESVPMDISEVTLATKQDAMNLGSVGVIGNKTALVHATVQLGSPATFGLRIQVHETDSGVLLGAVDVQTGTAAVNPAHIVSLSDTEVEVFYKDASGDLAARIVDLSTGSIGSANTITAGIGSYIDACRIDDNGGNTWICAVYDIGNVPQAKLLPDGATAGAITINPTFTLAGGYSFSQVGCCRWRDGQASPRVVLMWGETNLTTNTTIGYAEAYDMTGSIVGSQTTIATETNAENATFAGVETSDTNVRLYMSTIEQATPIAGTQSLQRKTKEYDFDSTTSTAITQTRLYATRIQMRPHQWNNADRKDYIAGFFIERSQSIFDAAFADDQTDQATLILAARTDATSGALQRWVPVAKLDPGATFEQLYAWPRQFAWPVDGDTFQFLQMERFRIAAALGELGTTGFRLVTATKNVRVQSLEAENLLYSGGSVPTVTGATELRDAGFHWYPDVPLATDVAGGSLTADTGYSYVAVPEMILENGDRLQGRPSITPATMTTTATNKTGHVVVPVMNITNNDNMYYAIYRTVVHADTSTIGTVYYRVGTTAPFGATVSECFQEFTDTVDDATAEKNEKLYTTGNVLANDGVPSWKIGTQYQGRFAVVSMEDPQTVLYSKQVAAGVPATFNSFLQIPFDRTPGGITGLGVVADKLIAFKEHEIWATEGEGMADTGFGAGYIEPYQLDAGVGCTAADTIVTTRAGIVFLALDNTLWLLTPSMQAVPIGEPVRWYTEQYTVVRGHVLPGRGYAIWTTSDGPALAWDWRRNRWSTFTNHVAVDSESVGDILYLLDGSGYIWRDDQAQYVDDGATTDYIPMEIRTGWIDLGRQGRIDEGWILGENINDHTLTVKIRYDYDPAWNTASLTFDSDGLENFSHDDYFGAGLASPDYDEQAYILRFDPPRQKCSAFQLSIADSQFGGGTPADASAGPVINRVICAVRRRADRHHVSSTHRMMG